MRKFSALIVLVLTASILSPALAAAPKPGTTCKTLSKKITSGGQVYTCIKSGSKKVWSKGVKVVVKPSQTPAPATSSSTQDNKNVETPYFGSIISTADGFTGSVINFNPDYSWGISSSAGSVEWGPISGSTRTFRVFGLVEGSRASVAVSAVRGNQTKTSTVSFSTSTTSSSTTTTSSSSTTSTTTSATPTPAPTSSQSFVAGQWLVGSQIQPGTYRTSTGGCYWERQKGLGGTTSDIIANGSTASNGGYITILSSDKAFSSRCSWTLDSGSSSSGTASNNSSTAVSGTPVVGKIISNSKWTAFEIMNPSKTENLTSPSFTVLAATSSGVVLIEARNDKFPMLKAGEKIWMYFPGFQPDVITLTRYPRSSNRPTNPNEWPEVRDAKMSGINIEFTLVNNSKTLRLSGDSIFYYFGLDASGVPVFADQVLLYRTLLPGGSSKISWPTLNGSIPHSSILVYIGPVYE